jgi:hypothetical protein
MKKDKVDARGVNGSAIYTIATLAAWFWLTRSAPTGLCWRR